jgi:hypothetical protein
MRHVKWNGAKQRGSRWNSGEYGSGWTMERVGMGRARPIRSPYGNKYSLRSALGSLWHSLRSCFDTDVSKGWKKELPLPSNKF